MKQIVFVTDKHKEASKITEYSQMVNKGKGKILIYGGA